VKVIAFNGSPRADGTVAKGISVVLGELAKEGIETETVHVGGKHIRGCVACMECRKHGRGCAVQETSAVGEAYEKMLAADGVVLGSPVYYGGIAGTFKSFLDRMFFPSGLGMSYKVGATVTSLRRSGGISVFHQLNNYFNLAQMIITPGIYWDVIHGNGADEAEKDIEGLEIMETQGRNMAWLLKTLAAGRPSLSSPALPRERKRTNFIR